ncbi:MAG: hypothetical protein ACXW3D_01270 [Caulobacteraceae bacterium]
MSAMAKGLSRPIGAVLEHTSSCFAPVIRERVAKGVGVLAIVFPYDGAWFAHVTFSDRYMPAVTLLLDELPPARPPVTG